MSSSWLFHMEEIKNSTPSRVDGINFQNECKYRKDCCIFMHRTGVQLRFPQITIATAIVFFQRFYMFYSFKKFEKYTMATTSLFLAGKVEETPKKLKEVIVISLKMQNKEIPKYDNQEFWEVKEKILFHERMLLQTIRFELTTEHPYKPLIGYVKSLGAEKNLAEVAWTFVNDSFRTLLCIQYKPQLIALATIYLASNRLDYNLNQKPWWQNYDARLEDLEDIMNQIIDSYDNQPNMEAIRPSNYKKTKGNESNEISSFREDHISSDHPNGNTQKSPSNERNNNGSQLSDRRSQQPLKEVRILTTQTPPIDSSPLDHRRSHTPSPERHNHLPPSSSYHSQNNYSSSASLSQQNFHPSFNSLNYHNHGHNNGNSDNNHNHNHNHNQSHNHINNNNNNHHHIPTNNHHHHHHHNHQSNYNNHSHTYSHHSTSHSHSQNHHNQHNNQNHSSISQQPLSQQLPPLHSRHHNNHIERKPHHHYNNYHHQKHYGSSSRRDKESRRLSPY